ncbi:hypothetical protein [Marinoscillum pacificum]|uniref:hypothetical protein n=1 Tax=Marinoscillum pacificum TaxID=392723 RepID=UPI0021582532|nr:hypothetical protein [Marinoscillum pacificum]
MKKLSHQYLGFGILSLDLAHVVASYFGFMDVHGLKVVGSDIQTSFNVRINIESFSKNFSQFRI